MAHQFDADRLGVRFCASRKHGADADVVRTVAFGGNRLRQRVRAETENIQTEQPLLAVRSRQIRPVFLAQMHAVGPARIRGRDVVIDDDRHGCVRGGARDGQRQREAARGFDILRPDLNDVHTAGDQLPGDHAGIASREKRRVNESVKPAIGDGMFYHADSLPDRPNAAMLTNGYRRRLSPHKVTIIVTSPQFEMEHKRGAVGPRSFLLQLPATAWRL